jgi:hypothetical protein
MKSVSFLRNTWRKWESKGSDSRGNPQNNIPEEHPKPSYSRSSAGTGRSLTVTVQHLPIQASNATSVDGSWLSLEGQDKKLPPSPNYDQFAQCRGEHSIIHRDSSRYALDVTYHNHGDSSPKLSKLDQPTTQTPSKHTPIQTRSNQAFSPVSSRDDRETRASGSRYLSLPRQPPPSPRSPTLPTYQILPPIDLHYGPGSKFEHFSEAGGCKCLRSGPQAKHHSRCPRYTHLEARKSMSPKVFSDTQTSQKTVHAVLDLSVDSKPRSLYHRTASTPHLPYKDAHKSKLPPSELSVYSTDGSEAEQFPLSLFPTPPPLIVRKKIPTPLLLRPLKRPSSPHSSRDSTPVGTPTTPRFHAMPSPSQSSVSSPGKKHFSLRPSASFSPPPFSPPNSPLPSLPTTPDGSQRPSEYRRSPDHGMRSLRSAQSNANLRDALPFPATHRLTSSEPISDQSSLPVSRPRLAARPRPEAVRAKDFQEYMVRFLPLLWATLLSLTIVHQELTTKEQSVSSSNSTDAHVQWGYAL